jgi:hypothetical protein
LHRRLVDCCLVGRRGDTEWVVARWQHSVATNVALGTCFIRQCRMYASTPPYGHQNGLQRRCIRSSPPPFLLGVIVAKDHVMVHLN